jgi:hypothetical protein
MRRAGPGFPARAAGLGPAPLAPGVLLDAADPKISYCSVGSMTDWKTVARAVSPDIPPGDLDRLTLSLAGLEALFRPLTAGLPPELEPLTSLALPEEEE